MAVSFSRSVRNRGNGPRESTTQQDPHRSSAARPAGRCLSAEAAGDVRQGVGAGCWQPQPSKRAAGKPHNFSQLPAEVQVIEAQLAEMRLPWSYADKIAKQMFGVAKVAWLKKPDQLTAILAALHVEQEKRYLLAEVDRLCQGLGIEHPEQAAGLEQLPKGWRRQRPILKALVETLQAAADSKRR
ncbi:MAG: phage protein GemA/Gp16 family protein [Pseudomonas aeruginosa]|nr:phage protein GemA/Gp16 family protein [Pseudomonas aeruginosa]